jgi:Zn ribbon nucleic-acid-binding protein
MNPDFIDFFKCPYCPQQLSLEEVLEDKIPYAKCSKCWGPLPIPLKEVEDDVACNI